MKNREKNRSYPTPESRISFSTTIDRERADSFLEQARTLREQHPDRAVTLYGEKLDADAEYFIRQEGDALHFKLALDGNILAELIFRIEGDVIRFTHRRVESQARGVNGTLFLKKAETYFRYLKERRLISNNAVLHLNAGQKNVIEWALQNGFAFTDEQQALFFFKVKSDDTYLTNASDFTDDGYERRGYIFNKTSHVEWLEENERRRMMGEKRITAAQAALRFELTKEI